MSSWETSEIDRKEYTAVAKKWYVTCSRMTGDATVVDPREEIDSGRRSDWMDMIDGFELGRKSILFGPDKYNVLEPE